MPNAPKVNFSIENNNVQESTPALGVSFVFARTTKGPKLDPSEIIRDNSHFARVFGEEIIPGSTVSSIEKAFNHGSKLRICRVLGSGSTQGIVPGTISFAIDGKSVEVGFKTQGYGDPIDGQDTFKVKLVTQTYATYLQVISAATGVVLENIYLYKYDSTAEEVQIDATGITRFNALSQYLTLYIKKDDSGQSINTPSKLKAWLDASTSAITITPSDGSEWESTTGNPGSEPTLKEWKEALDVLRDYTDVYNVAFSGINHHLSPTDVVQLHKEVRTLFDELQEWRYTIEIPWWNADNSNYKSPGDPTDDHAMNALAKQWIGTIGNSMWVGYFGGGLQYYDSEGELQNADCIGDVIGLADAVATSRGYWESFAGLQKGIVPDAISQVVPNYGSPARKDQLDELAQNYINIFCTKDTRNSGRRVVLWGCFTSQFKQDSFQFQSVVGLVLYLKKTLRPILDNYVEEPCHWSSWKKMYGEVKPILDSIVDANGMTEYHWLGDQDAQKYEDLSVNKEADVRQGKYKVFLKFKEVVMMQEITLVLSIDAASKSVSITQA